MVDQSMTCAERIRIALADSACALARLRHTQYMLMNATDKIVADLLAGGFALKSSRIALLTSTDLTWLPSTIIARLTNGRWTITHMSDEHGIDGKSLRAKTRRAALRLAVQRLLTQHAATVEELTANSIATCTWLRQRAA